MKRRTALVGLVALIVAALLFVGTGALNAWIDTRTHRAIHYYDEDGLIWRARARLIDNDADTLLVLVHGYGGSPLSLAPLAEEVDRRTEVDIHLLRLAYHGGSLDDLEAFDGEVTRERLRQAIAQAAEGYERVVLVAHSLGGTLVADLAAAGALPEASRVILFSPALWITGDTPASRWSLQAYRLWSSTCSFRAIGCGMPPRDLDTPEATARMYEQNLYFVLLPESVLSLLAFTEAVRERVASLGGSFDVIMAEDDPVVPAPRVRAWCAGQTGCRFHAFESGGHMIQFTDRLDDLTSLVVRLTDDPEATCAGLPCTTSTGTPGATAAERS